MGGVIYIGDRKAGKTHLAMELTNKADKKCVEVTNLDYDILKSLLYDSNKGETRGTNSEASIYKEYMEVEVKLGMEKPKTISSDWIDTPGDIWRTSWQQKNRDQWEIFLDSIQKAEGILLIFPPYREIIDPRKAVQDDYMTREQWTRRFERWIKFFEKDCPQVRHLLLCVNKVDHCITEYQDEAKKLAYDPTSERLSWQTKHDYVYRRYFSPFRSQIKRLNKSFRGASVRCFITTIYSRELLELPWIYLGSYLGKYYID